ncbi:MAG: sugar transferase [Flavobacteriaceae bacterium]|nr:sugar transferase [Flavobacteriaceae bacterium]
MSKIHFEISERKLLLRIFDVLAVLTLVFWLGRLFGVQYLNDIFTNVISVFLLVLYLLLFASIFEMYDLRRASRIQETLQSVFVSASIAVLAFLFTPILTPSLPGNRSQIIVFYLSVLFALLIWRTLYIKLFASQRFRKRILLVCAQQNVAHLIEELHEVDPNIEPVGFINTSKEIDRNSTSILKMLSPNESTQTLLSLSFSEVVVAIKGKHKLNNVTYQKLIALMEAGISIRDYTQVYEEITNKVPLNFIGKNFYSYFPFSRSNQNKLYLFYARIFNFLIALVLLIPTLVLIPIVFLLNFIGNRGPLFYLQERVGQNARVFRIIKFRTMVVHAEQHGPEWSTKNDVRITPFGKCLRVTRIDELPQVFNVLKGEMSIIGPRPERPVYVQELSKKIPFYEIRHLIKPGLTGWAQVKGRYASSIEEAFTKFQYDLYYIKHRSILLDLRIMVKTITTVLFLRGT